jgi:3-oxoacyl-ACP reductase-like protein
LRARARAGARARARVRARARARARVRARARARVRRVLETFRLERAEPIQELPLVHLLRPKRGEALAFAAALAAAHAPATIAAAAAAAADGVSQHEELLAQRLDAWRELLREGQREQRQGPVLVELEQPLQRLACKIRGCIYIRVHIYIRGCIYGGCIYIRCIYRGYIYGWIRRA